MKKICFFTFLLMVSAISGILAVRKNGKKTTTSKPLTAKEIINCTDRTSERQIIERGEYIIYQNLVPMSMNVSCWETLTYATQGSYTFLDNLEPLLERWRAPISIAIYAPGNDLEPTLDSIKYLKSCSSPLVSQFVTFHVYVHKEHIRGKHEILQAMEKNEIPMTYNCSLAPPWAGVLNKATYKDSHNLIYPVNVGRNIAKEAALTHYLIVADIELYPSPNLATEFLEMIRKNELPKQSTRNPKVFVLPPFELIKNSKLPNNKTELVKMLNERKAFPFHKRICSVCHAVPGELAWKKVPETKSLRVFRTAKRTGSFKAWEPVFIGTRDDPIYDERVSWDGQKDKRIQGWLLCAFNYEFHVLNNAFLVHRPGVKVPGPPKHPDIVAKTDQLIRNVIVPEYEANLGSFPQCTV